MRGEPNPLSGDQAVGRHTHPAGLNTSGGQMVPLWVFIIFGIVVAAGLLVLIIRDIAGDED